MARDRNSDLIGGTIGLVLAAAFWLAREDNWSFWSAVFPNVMIVVIALLSVLLLVKGFIRPALLPLFIEGDRVKMVATAVLLLLWGVAFSRLGVLASSFLGFAVLGGYLAVGVTEINPRRVLLGVTIVVAELAVFYLLFTRVLHVPLPSGVLF